MGNACCTPYCVNLQEDEQVLENGCTKRCVFLLMIICIYWFDRRTRNGPGCLCIPPFVGTKVRKGIVLDETKYVHVRNELNGDMFTKVGPQLYFPGPYDVVIETRDVS